MKVPEQIVQFAADVLNETTELSKLVAKYNDLLEKKQKISEISKEYLKVQPIGDPEDVRKLLIMGIDVELRRIRQEVDVKIDHIYLGISCKKPYRIDQLEPIELNQQ